jgi:hypothetical protein
MIRPFLFAAPMAALLFLGGFAVPAAADEGLDDLGIRVERRLGASHTLGKGPAVMGRPVNGLPDGLPGYGGNDIAAAWLIGPSGRYDHGVLGDAIEARGLRAELADGRSVEHRLGPESVFEDLRPRVADLDGDGRDEIIAVRSYLGAGAALAVFHVRGARLVPLTETKPIGQPYRWLNPVGVGDFDGDGGLEIAYVETPHIGGTLRIFALDGGHLVEEGSLSGVSNHARGSRAIGLSAILDMDGDGSDDLLIPADGRRALRIISFAGGVFTELGRVAHPASIVTDFVVSDRDGNGRDDIAYGLADASLVELLR